MSTTTNPNTTASFGATERRDAWWIGPLTTAIVLIAFGIYSTWAAAQNGHYEWGPYLSPFYSPLLTPAWLPSWVSPAFLILIFPLGFRATCYYYRKAYYRAFFFSPPGCTVGNGTREGYTGERALPFVLQNLHRFFLYAAIVFVFILGYEAVKAFFWEDGFHMGLGTLVLVANTVLLAGYTFGCHSLRHLVGGKIDCFSCHVAGKTRHDAWRGVSWLNGRHMQFAWASLFSVALADLYIRLVSMGVITDIRFF